MIPDPLDRNALLRCRAPHIRSCALLGFGVGEVVDAYETGGLLSLRVALKRCLIAVPTSFLSVLPSFLPAPSFGLHSLMPRTGLSIPCSFAWISSPRPKARWRPGGSKAIS